MSILSENLHNGRDSNGESLPSQYVGGRISRCAGHILSLAPSVMVSLKVSVSSLAFGSVMTASLLGGGSLFSELHSFDK